MITKEFGAETAKAAGDAHEVNPDTDKSKRTFTGSETNLQNADDVIDLNNNVTGRQIGADNPNASNKTLALKVLEQYKDKGLYTATVNKDGSVSIGITKLSKSEYDKSVNAINKLNDQGFTPKEQKQFDEKDKKALDDLKRRSRTDKNEE